jgi:hypothetical protein
MAAAFAFGSFGVPVKSKVASRLDIDPLVMQVRWGKLSVISSLHVLYTPVCHLAQLMQMLTSY